MQAILLRQPGSLDTIELADVPKPHAGPGELLVRVLAAGVNPADWKVAQRGMPGWRLPQVLGLDGVGIVEAVADGVQGFRPGNTVWFHQGLTRLGAFAEFIAVEAALASHAPRSLTPLQAAAVPTPGFTAWQVLLDRVRWDGVRSALVLGGSGAVAAFAVQGLAQRGIEVIATASPGREHVPRGLGAHHVMALGALGDRQADLVIETAGTPESISAALTACRYGGQLVCCNGWRPMPPVDGWPRGVTVHDVFLGAAVDQADPQVRARIGALGAALAAQIDAGRVRVPDAGAVAPSQVPELLRRMAAGAAPGKFVIPWFQESSP